MDGLGGFGVGSPLNWPKIARGEVHCQKGTVTNALCTLIRVRHKKKNSCGNLQKEKKKILFFVS